MGNSIGTAFRNNKDIILFNEFKYFLNIKNILENCFNGCSSLINIYLKNISNIDFRGFENCSSLIHIDLSNITSIGQESFRGCNNLIDVGDTSNIINIGSSAFIFCNSLKKFILNEKITRLNNTFDRCYSLEYININNITYINNQTFQYCNKLIIDNDLTIVTYIGYMAFRQCSSLTSIKLKDITYIGQEAFRDINVKYIYINNTIVPETGSNPFANIKYNIYVPDESLESYKSATNWSKYAARIKGLSTFTQ